MSSVSSACPLGVRAMFDTVPIWSPDTSTRSPLTIWLAFWKHRADLVAAATGEHDDRHGDEGDRDRRYRGDPADHS